MFYAGCASIIFGCSIALYATFRDVKNSVSFVVMVMISLGLLLIFADGITEVNLPFGLGFKKAISQAIADAGTIADLKNRVTNQSATVDLIANKAAQAEIISIEAEKHLKDARSEIEQVRSIVAQATATLDKLNKTAKITTLISDAMDDDRAALDELFKIAQDKSDPDHLKADHAWMTITSSAFSATVNVLRVPWQPGVNPDLLSLSDLELIYHNLNTQVKQMAILQFIRSRGDIDQTSKLDFFLKIAETDKSIKNTAYALRAFYTTTKTGSLDIFDIVQARDWWSRHKSEYFDKH